MFTEYGSPAKSCIFVGSPVLMLFWYHLHVSATNDLVSILGIGSKYILVMCII